MGQTSILKRYRLIIIMGASIGIIHWGWYRMQLNPIFNPDGRDASVMKFFGKIKDDNEK